MFNHMHVIFIIYSLKGLKKKSVKLPSCFCAFKPQRDEARAVGSKSCPWMQACLPSLQAFHFKKEKESRSPYPVIIHGREHEQN